MIEQRTAPYAALLLRLTLGSLFIAHLYWKFAILPGGIEKWWSSLEANGYPWFVPAYVFSAEYVIESDGSVEDVLIIQSSGHQMLDEAAIAHFKKRHVHHRPPAIG